MINDVNASIGVNLYQNVNFLNDGIGWAGFIGPGMHSGDFPSDVVTSYNIDEGCCASFFEKLDY